MKKAICLMISIIMIFSIAYSVSASVVVVNPGYDATYDEASLDQAIPGNPTAKGRCGKDVYWGYYEDTKTLVINGEGKIDLGVWENQPEYSVYPFEKAIVGEGVTELGSNSFTKCSSVKTITLPESLETIGSYVFFSCEKLESITIPRNVKQIGLDIFAYCNNLEKIVVAPENTVYDSRYGCNAIVNTEYNEIIVGCKTTKVPYSVVSIGSMAFYHCEGIEAIRLHADFEIVKNMAFEGCTNLSKINVYNPELIVQDVMGSAIPSTTTIYGYKGSTIEQYAQLNKKTFKSLSGKYMPMGDADDDGYMSVMDSTEIQLYAAQRREFSTSQLRCSDMDGDWNVSVIDATAIQRKIAQLE